MDFLSSECLMSYNLPVYLNVTIFIINVHYSLKTKDLNKFMITLFRVVAFGTIVLQDCVASIEESAHEQALKYMKDIYGTWITTSDKVL